MFDSENYGFEYDKYGGDDGNENEDGDCGH